MTAKRSSLLILLIGCVAVTLPAAAQEPNFGVTYVSPLHVFTLENVIGDYTGATYGEDPQIVCLGPVCPGEDPVVDKDGDTLYPVDHTFGFDVMDFVGAEDKVRDGIYREGWAATYRDASGNVIGVKISNNDTAMFKSGSPKGTWCSGLGGVSVKCESEHLTVMEHVLTCDQTVPYTYYRDLDGDPAPDPTWPCAPLEVIPNDQIAPLAPNESSVVEEIVVGSQYAVTKKDDGKILYRWGTAVKRPTDMRLYSRIPLPDAWKVPGVDYRVLRAEMVVRHRVTNNPNDQLRPEDWENEGATGRKPHVLVDQDGFWYSTVDCYEGDGDFIPAGTIFRDPTCGGGGCDPDAYSADLVAGLSNAWYTTIDRDPFAWWYDDATGELISGPRWRLLSNKFGQDVPGLEIPLVDCDPPPYEHGTLRYEVGDEAVTVINLLDWNEKVLLDAAGDPILDPSTGEPVLSRSPFLQTADWISTNDPNTGASRCAMIDGGGRCISENGLPLTDDFDLAVYVKGDKKPLVIYDAQVRVEYAVDNPIDLGDAPDGFYDGLTYAYPTRLPGGAAHSVAVDSLGDPLLLLGEAIDVELDGLSTSTALGDDDQGFVDDEDGVTFVTALVPGRDARVQVQVTASSEFVGTPYVHLWLDVNGDRAWSVDEKMLAVAVPLGKTTLRFAVPEFDAVYEGPTFVRVRLSTAEALDAGGAAPDGEVEDYEVALRGRGFDDIVGLDVDEVMVAESTGVSFASRYWTQLPTAAWTDLRVGDFDGDLRQDVAVRRDDTDQWWVALAMTNPTGVDTFDAPNVWGGWPAGEWVDVLVGDFNGDGLDDLAGRRPSVATAQQWRVLLSTGTAFVDQVWGSWSAGFTWVDVAVGSFNGDAFDDIVGRRLEDGSWYVAESDGTGFGSAETRYGSWPTQIPWIDVRYADFNGDGLDDAAGRNADTGNWFVSLLEPFGVDQTLVFADGFESGDTTAWSLVVGLVAAIDGADPALKVERGVGDLNYRFADQEMWASWNPLGDFGAVRAGDFDGNGLADLAGLDLDDGKWHVALSTGALFDPQVFGQWPTAPGTTWLDVLVGDYNGDGLDDVAGRTGYGGWTVGLSTGSSFFDDGWGSWSAGVYTDVQTGDFDLN